MATTWGNQPKGGGGLTWNDATQMWEEMEITWEGLEVQSYSNQTKNTATWTDQSKS